MRSWCVGVLLKPVWVPWESHSCPLLLRLSLQPPALTPLFPRDGEVNRCLERVLWSRGVLTPPPQLHPFSGWTWDRPTYPDTLTCGCSSHRLERSRNKSPAFHFSLRNFTYLQTVDGWLSPPVRYVTGLS